MFALSRWLRAFFFGSTPNPLRLTAQTAPRAKIFRDILQKYSPIHKVLPALFAASDEKFSGAIYRLNGFDAAP
ncbi:hypothetical protein [Pseudoflavonifractor sp. An187]|uniref:hypothetical protein n=1 Tax=Pseudoflavonifractor sp. An187 TaxID=1965578 RepID=UPI00117AB8F0|nr:hypothetical protein [Pseudoflavonifractor sp. An187]